MQHHKNHAGHERRFSVLSQAYYADATLSEARRKLGEDRVTMGFYAPDGGCSGEFSIKWVSKPGKLVPVLSAFGDGWSALAGFTDVLEALRELDDDNPSVDDVCAVLHGCGVVDATLRENPEDTSKRQVFENIYSGADVAAVYVAALQKLRAMGIRLSGDSNWASEAGHSAAEIEGGVNFPSNLLEEVERLGMVVLRQTKELERELEAVEDSAELVRLRKRKEAPAEAQAAIYQAIADKYRNLSGKPK